MCVALWNQASSDNSELASLIQFATLLLFPLYLWLRKRTNKSKDLSYILWLFVYLKKHLWALFPQLSYKFFTKQVLTNCNLAEPSVFRWVQHILFLLKLRFPSCGAAQSRVAVCTDMFWLAALPFLAAAAITAWVSSTRRHNKLQSVLCRLMSVRYSWSVLGTYVSSI